MLGWVEKPEYELPSSPGRIISSFSPGVPPGRLFTFFSSLVILWNFPDRISSYTTESLADHWTFQIVDEISFFPCRISLSTLVDTRNNDKHPSEQTEVLELLQCVRNHGHNMDFQTIDTSNESVVSVPFPGPFPYIIHWKGITMLQSEAVPLIQLNV